MRIWHQSFTVLDDVPHYRDAMARHLATVVGDDTVIDFHGMAPGTYPSDYPGVHIGYAYLAGLHKEQFVRAAQRAQAEGYDAFVIATIPDTGFEECRSVVDIPVLAFGNTSMGSPPLGTGRIVHFIGGLRDQIRATCARTASTSRSRVQVDALPRHHAAYAEPDRLLGAFRPPRHGHRRRRRRDRPGEGPLNVFLADQGVARRRRARGRLLGTCCDRRGPRAATGAAG
jgi:hypothetical protein